MRVWINNVEYNFTEELWRSVSTNQIHRDGDEPAIIDPGHKMLWYKHGKLHRENGPARVNSNGYKEWYYEGKLHRLDGPAIEWPQKNLYQWYINGKHRTFSILDWIEENNIDVSTKEGQMAMKLRWS